MGKSGNGDGVSQSGDDGGENDADPEVTAITRRLDDTGDTLDAIRALQQLIVERTGAIPIITPELSRGAVAAESRLVPDPGAAESAPAPEPEPEAERVPEPEPEPEPESVPASGPESEPEIDWSLPAPPRVDGEPHFSDWVDPDAISAAIDTEPALSYSDVTTQVFAVFSADRTEPEAPPEPEPAPAPEATAHEPSRDEPEEQPLPLSHTTPLAPLTGSLDITPPSIVDDIDNDDDVVDDADNVALAELRPLASVQPPVSPTTGPQQPLPSGPVAAPHGAERAAADARAEPHKRRRFWLFGRR